MPQITYSFPYNNEKQGLVLGVSDLIQSMFFGVTLCSPNGDHISNQTIEFYIAAAQQQVERILNVYFVKTVVDEAKDFYREDWGNWGMIQTTYPVRKAFQLDGYINTIRQIKYPAPWLSVRKTSDGKMYRRNIFLVPNQGAQVDQNAIVYSGITPHLGFMGMSTVPNYWSMIYISGFDKLPEDIIYTIKLLAAIPIYMMLGNSLLSKAGLTSQSISIDGLSQSKSIEAGGYTSRINQIRDELMGKQNNGLLAQLKEYYNGFELTAA